MDRTKDQSGDNPNAQIGKVILPTLAVAVVIILVALIVSAGGGGALPALVNNVADGTAGGMSLTRPTYDSGDWKEISEGLKSWDVKEGEGEAVKAGDTVECHYSGWLKNGESFDSSLKNGNKATFNLNGVIRGWTLGLPGLKPGGIRRLYVPAALGYGERGSPPKIGPNEDLIFEVKLLRVVPPAPSGNSSDRSPDGMGTSLPPLGGSEWKDFKEGIKIWDTRPGEGPECPEGASVTIHYTGWLKNGVKFDSSVDRGMPANFALSGLIKGWQIAVPGMKPGGVRRMLIPYKLAYGEEGRPPQIPAAADLVFEIKLIAFN